MKIALIRERKNPPDKRVVFSPEACKSLMQEFPDLEIKVESSPIRVFKDEEYEAAGIEVCASVDDCDVLLGVKEVPMDALIPNKKYFFFSHTIKKQPYNKKLLQTILEKNIELYDHEVITNQKGSRVVAFGRYAGIVGAYNGVRAWGMKFGSFDIEKAENLPNQKALIDELNRITLPNIKILLTGKGRVSNGAKEMIDAMGIQQVSTEAYLNNTFDRPVYAQIDVMDYNKRKDGEVKDKYDFYNNPGDYESNFMRFAAQTDFYISGHFFGSGSPYLFTRADMKDPSFKIKVVADVSCDIDGPVACTIKPSTIADPVYGYDPMTESEVDYTNEGAIAVMAVDNLPCELPNDASVGFGKMFAEHVIPAFFDGDSKGVLHRAKMTENGGLTEGFAYLTDYVK